MNMQTDNSVTKILFSSDTHHVTLQQVHILYGSHLWPCEHAGRRAIVFGCKVLSVKGGGGGIGDICHIKWCWHKYNWHFLKIFWNGVVQALEVFASVLDGKSSYWHTKKLITASPGLLTLNQPHWSNIVHEEAHGMLPFEAPAHNGCDLDVHQGAHPPTSALIGLMHGRVQAWWGSKSLCPVCQW